MKKVQVLRKKKWLYEQKNFTRFFQEKKSSYSGIRRDSSSKKDFRSVKNDDDSEDESEK